MRPKWKYKEPHYSDYMLGELKLAYIQENILPFSCSAIPAIWQRSKHWTETQTLIWLRSIET